MQIRIKHLQRSMRTHTTSVFKDTNIAKHLSDLPRQVCCFPDDKASNNIVFVHAYVNHISGNWHAKGYQL